MCVVDCSLLLELLPSCVMCVLCTVLWPLLGGGSAQLGLPAVTSQSETNRDLSSQCHLQECLQERRGGASVCRSSLDISGPGGEG